MIDYKKIKKLKETIQKNRDKMSIEKDYKKKQVLEIKIKIDELKVKMERLKY